MNNQEIIKLVKETAFYKHTENENIVYVNLEKLKDKLSESQEGNVEKKTALINKLDEYIKLLADELSETVPFAAGNNWKSQRYDTGVKLREEIKALRED